MASPIPVLPLVASTTVGPGLSRPVRSASSMTPRAKRSLTDPMGLKASILTYRAPCPGAGFLILTPGVRPIVSRMLSNRFLARASRVGPAGGTSRASTFTVMSSSSAAGHPTHRDERRRARAPGRWPHAADSQENPSRIKPPATDRDPEFSEGQSRPRARTANARPLGLNGRGEFEADSTLILLDALAVDNFGVDVKVADHRMEAQPLVWLPVPMGKNAGAMTADVYNHN